MRYKHILWDWNGTLLDDVWLGVKIINQLLQRRGLPEIDLKRYHEVFDFPVVEYYKKVGLDLESESFEAIAEEYISLYERQCIACHLQPHAEWVLSEIGKKGIYQSILSASHRDSLEQMVKHFRIDGYFKHLLGLDNHYAQSKVKNGKDWMAQSGYDGDDVVLIGDTVHDFEVAQAMGIHCILVSRGHHSREKLLLCGVKVLDGIEDLILRTG